MASSIRQALNVQGSALTLFCGNMSRVGFGITGNWTGLVSFFYSQDAVNFIPLFVVAYPPPAGLAVAPNTTVNGNFEAGIKNALAVRAVLTTLTSGTVNVTIAAAIDSSYQDAFLSPTSKYLNQAATGATNTLVQAAQANRAWRLRTLSLTLSAAATWASSPALQVLDGSSAILWAGDPPTAQGSYLVPLPADENIPGLVTGGVIGTPGNQMQVVLASAGGAIKTNLNAEFVAA